MIKFGWTRIIVYLNISVVVALSMFSIYVYGELKQEQESNATTRMLISYALYDDMYSMGVLIDEMDTSDNWAEVVPFLKTDAEIAELLNQKKVYELAHKITATTQAYEDDLIDFQMFMSEMKEIKKEIDFTYLSDPEAYL